MPFFNMITEIFSLFLPFATTAAVCGALLWGTHWILIGRHPEIGNERMFPRQLVMLGLTLAGTVALVLALPVSDSSRNQVIGLIGLVISGIFAFSSSTIFTNLMAGIMLRVTKPFRTGDFVSVGNHFGRVAERGLLDTEIQTESRELLALPNTYLITNPVSVVRTSGTIVSVKLSLGYDIHHSEVESLLMDAVKKSGLDEPFIQILELGDHSITYKANGLLTDIKILLTARSTLCRSILDTLHNHGIEILSPAYMNQRRLSDEMKVIPRQMIQELSKEIPVAEEVVFDKAEQAEQAEKEKQQFIAAIEECQKALEGASGKDKKRLEEKMEECRERLKLLEHDPG